MAMKPTLQVDISMVIGQILGLEHASELKTHMQDIDAVARQASKEIQVFANYLGIAFNSQNVRNAQDLERELAKSGMSARSFGDQIQIVARNIDGLRGSLNLVKGANGLEGSMGSLSVGRMDAIAQVSNAYKSIVSAEKEVASLQSKGISGEPYRLATEQLKYYQQELINVKANLGVMNTEEDNAVGKIARKNEHIIEGIHANRDYNEAINAVLETQRQLADVEARIRGVSPADQNSEYYQTLVKQRDILKDNLNTYNEYATTQAGVSKQTIKNLNDEYNEKQKVLNQQAELNQKKEAERIENQKAAQINREYLSSLQQQHQAELELLRLQQQAGSTPSATQSKAILSQQQYVNQLKATTAELDTQRQQFQHNDAQMEMYNSTTQKAGLQQSKFSAQVDKTTMEVQKQTSAFSSALTSMKQMFTNVLFSAVSWKIVSAIINGIKNAISTVKELDKALVSLQIASGGTRQSAEELLVTYNELGRELGATTLDIADAATQWIRQGYSIADTNTLIKNSMILSKVGQIESAEATKYLTSAMKGYKVSVEDSLGVIDKFTKVDLIAATSSADLAEAMSRTASSANLAGVSMDKLLGYLATTQEVTQKSASSIGESYKSIFARFGQIKAGKFVDDETGEDLSDVQKVLAKFNIELYDAEGNMRNVGSILDEVASKWNTYNDVQKNALTTALAGTRQRENLIVLFENYGNALKYEEAALNSAGTASQKFAIYQNSLEAAQERITNAFEKFSQTLIDSGTIKGLSQIAEKGIDVLSTLAKIRPVLQGILQILLVFKTLHFASMLIAEGKAVKALKSAYDKFKTTLVDMRKFRTLNTEAAKLQKEATEAQTVATRLQSRADDTAMAASMGKATAAEAEAAATAAATAQTEANIKATKAQEAAQKAATATMNFWVAIVTLAITVITSGIRAYKNYKEAMLQASATARQNAEDYKKTAENIRKVGDEYLELSKKITLSQEDVERQKQLQDQLLEYADSINIPENTRIDIINLQNKSYSEQLEIIKQIHGEAVQMSEDEAKEAIAEVKRGMKPIGKITNGSYFIRGIGGAPEELELMTQRGFVFDTQIGQFLLEGKFADSADATAQAYLRLIDVKKQLERELTTDELKDSPLYKSIGMWMKDYEEGAKGYIAGYQALAQSASYVQDAIKSANVTDEASLETLITQVQDKAREAGEDSEIYLSAISDYLRQFYADVIAKSKQDTDDGTKANTAFKESFASLQKEMATVREAYSTLTSAIKEYNDSGYISVDTFEKLLTTYPQYLKYLFDENGHIQDNTDALKENIKIKIYSEALSSANDLIAKAEAGDLSMLTDAIREDTEARKTNLEIQLKEIYTRINAMDISKQQKQMLWEEVGYRLKLADATVASLNSTSSATSSEDKYAKAVKYAQQVLQDKIDALKKEKEAIQERNEETQKELDLMDKALAYAKDLANDRIKALEEEKNALKEKNDEKEKELELQRLEENLANAKRRKIRVYRQDIDKWVWESDESEVADAQKALDDFKLEQQTEAIDTEIEKWNEYIEKLGEVTSVYEEEQKKLAFEQMAQYITQEGVNSRNLKQLEDFAKAYANKQRQMAENTTDEIDKQINKYEELKDQWGQIKTDYENAENARIAAQLLGAGAEEAILNGRLDTYEEFKKKYDAYLDGQADKASSTATTMVNAFSSIREEFEKFKKEFDEKEVGTMSWMQSMDGVSWTQSMGGVHQTRVPQRHQNQNRFAYASGTKSSARGIALTDENGLELRIPNKGNLRFLKEGTGVLPNNLTERVFAMASNPVSYARKVAESMSNKTVNNTSKHITIGNVSLPNVTNAQSFIKELEIITQNR